MGPRSNSLRAHFRDSEGRYLGPSKYPGAYSPAYSYAQDTLGRPVKMTMGPLNYGDPSLDIVKDVTYGPAGELTQMRTATVGGTLLETRGYNTLGQLTRITAPGVADLEYRFAAGQNNGRITQMKDWVSGEEVSYSYDSLNRLIQAVTTGPQYGLNFSYDGFGNLTQEQVFQGTGYNMNLAYNGTTNRIVTAGYLYDYNGNLTAMPYLSMSYDVQNRLIQTDQTPYGTTQYGYNPGGQRVWKRNPSIQNSWLIDYYGADGKLMSNCWAQFQDWDPNSGQWNVFSGACETERLYFGGKHVRTQTAPRLTDYAGVVIDGAGPVTVDRLGSAGNYYPYGEARTNGTEFATYQRDNTGLDYAQNRYYSSQIARFTTADPYQASGGPAKPQSWNRYAYVGNDPINFGDPTGLWRGCPNLDCGGSPSETPVGLFGDRSALGGGYGAPVIDEGNTEGIPGPSVVPSVVHVEKPHKSGDDYD